MVRSCLTALLVSCVIFYVSCADSEYVTNAENNTISGARLFQMGTRFNKPLLRLIGKSLMNMDCKHHPCTAWTQWSPCKLFFGQYGMKTRTRQCGGCGSNPTKRKDKQSEVCQEFCPSDYEMTQEGYCLKFYNSTFKTNAEGEDSCKKDGGYLININSENKWEAFYNLLKRKNYSSCVGINGQRKNTSSPWIFTYEEYIRGFTKWYSGQPNNGGTELCMCAKYIGWYDVTCTVKRYYVCEVVPA